MHLLHISKLVQDKFNQIRQQLKREADLAESIDMIVWDYLRIRLQTGIPSIDPTIETGQPATLDGYTVSAKLGEGSFGIVCKLTKNSGDDSIVEVLKMVDKQHMTNYRGIASWKRHMNVMRILNSQEKRHPNIIQLYEVYHSETHILLRMEYGGSMDLYKRLLYRDDHRLDLCCIEMMSILTQCMSALCHLHSVAHIVHRDIKPENLIISTVSDEITVKLTDFDTAAIVPHGAVCRCMVGTFPFIAPEIVLAERYDPYAADVWSLAMVFLEVLSGLRIIQRMLHVRRPQNRREQKTMMTTIEQSFSRKDFVHSLLDSCSLPAVADRLDDLKSLHAGMLDVDASERWTVHRAYQKLQEVLNRPLTESPA
jgi:serine/threonine protein kinase